MKTILVTGAAGYIGRHVVKNALDRGCKVIASDFSFKGVDERAEFCDVPIFSGDKEIYRKVGSPDICIHLAWRDGFRHKLSGPYEGPVRPRHIPEQPGGRRPERFKRHGHYARSGLLGGCHRRKTPPASPKASTASPKTPCAKA